MANNEGNQGTGKGSYTGQGQAQTHQAGGQASGQGQGEMESEPEIGVGYGKDTGRVQGTETMAGVDNLEVDDDETNQGGRSDSPESNKKWSPGSGQADA
jgi:hypothetical protein